MERDVLFASMKAAAHSCFNATNEIVEEARVASTRGNAGPLPRSVWPLYARKYRVEHAHPFSTRAHTFATLRGTFSDTAACQPLSTTDRTRLARALQPDRVSYSPLNDGKPAWVCRITGGPGSGSTPFSRTFCDEQWTAFRADAEALRLELAFSAAAAARDRESVDAQVAIASET